LKHNYRKIPCPTSICEEGVAIKGYYILTGDILDVWKQIGNILDSSNLPLVRCTLDDGRKFLGVNICEDKIARMRYFLQSCEQKI